MPRIALRPLGWTAALILSAGALVACGGDDDDAAADGDDTTTTTADSTTTTEPDVTDDEEAILAAYDAQWADFIRASDPPDPTADYLADHMTGKVLSTTIGEIEKFAAEGVGLRGEFDTRAEVIEMTDDTAVVAECGFDRTETYRLSTGEVISGFDEEPDTLTANMVLDDGTWKIDTFGSEQPECES